MNTDAEFKTGAKARCTEEALNGGIAGVRDALYVLNGKWKLPLIFALS
jgi:hypothetical protein